MEAKIRIKNKFNLKKLMKKQNMNLIKKNQINKYMKMPIKLIKIITIIHFPITRFKNKTI